MIPTLPNSAGLELKIVDTSFFTALAKMLHQHKSYAQNFFSSRKWAFGEHGPDNYTLAIRADKRSAAEHVREYNGLTALEVAVIVPWPEEGEVWERNIILSRFAALLNTGNEALCRIYITYRSYDQLLYIHFSARWQWLVSYTATPLWWYQ